MSDCTPRRQVQAPCVDSIRPVWVANAENPAPIQVWLRVTCTDGVPVRELVDAYTDGEVVSGYGLGDVVNYPQFIIANQVASSGGGASQEAPVTFTVTDGTTSATPGTATDAYAGDPAGRFLRIANVSTTDTIRVRLGDDATATDEAIAPGGSFEVPYLTTNRLSVISAGASVPFVMYVGAYA